MRPQTHTLLLVFILPLWGTGPACTASEEPEPFCGDGIVQEEEECDTGSSLSDTTANACRTSCTRPSCGDGVTDPDAGETCDDTNAWGGDGCSPNCQDDLGGPEQEPNDNLDQAQAISGGEQVTGALLDGDRDCYVIQVEANGWLAADLVGDGLEHCPTPSTLTLYSPDGNLLATGSPDSDEGCSPILPSRVEAARFMEAGEWTLCVDGFQGLVVPTYTLQWESGSDSCALDGVPVLPADDPDDDGLINLCDEDDDGDGVVDEDDNCPHVPNGPADPNITSGSSGFLRHWLLAGPYFGNDSDEACRPSEVPLLGSDDDGNVSPHVGDIAGDSAWSVHIDDDFRIDFEHLRTEDAPREVYILNWLYSATDRPVVLALGPDDGVRAWLNGEEVGEVDGCQGTSADQFRFNAQLLNGWNPLLLKVYDQGGGWGTYVRLYDAKSNTIVDDLGVSLTPDGPWADDQTDTDDDGLGDYCDPDPLN
ncbi:MAG TPA: hypothetical protein DIU15_10575 [Deltaproteobacteria bacterium]|nr:hypothetical protein [Deltaproteobacteria bacterium]HCP46480.1 hypothetical protein [Deltaproteobacteria bacterium]